MKLEVIKHRDILFRDLLRAIAMKSVGWPHSLESQVRWIVENMHDEDEHVFLKDGDKDMAYMTLSPVTGMLNGSLASFLGVGCVCSAKPGMGGGKMLMHNVNELIKERKTVGLLFCKNELVKFYSKYGWQLIPKQALILEPGHDSINTMLFNCHVDGVLEYKDKLF